MTPTWVTPPSSSSAIRSCSSGADGARHFSEVAVVAKPRYGLAKRGPDGRRGKPELAAGFLIAAVLATRQKPNGVLIETWILVREKSGLEEIFGHRDGEHEARRNAQARAWARR